MSKERYNQIIDDTYKNYLIEDVKVLPNMSKEKMTEMGFRLSKDEFINKCKTNKDFSEKWGLKIEEREISLEERSFLANSNHYEVSQNIKMNLAIDEDHTLHKHLDDIGIPTKQITLTYQDESIQFYE
jgi:hypothetical protein